MKGIYKFTCNKNGKSYIGQSVNIEARYKSHSNNHNNTNLKNDYNTKFYRALRKHGIENFSFEVVEVIEDSELLNEREKFWIDYYDSFENGYNSTPGGGSVTGNCDKHPNAKNSNEEVLKIKELLVHSKLSQTDIGKKFGLTQSAISLINLGERWSDLGEYEYPLRKKEARLSGQDSPRTVLNDEIVMEIRNRYVEETAREIYKDYEDLCSYTTFERALMGRTYKYLPIYKKRDKYWTE